MESVLLKNLTSTNNLTFEVLATDCACVCVYIWCMIVLKSTGIKFNGKVSGSFRRYLAA